MVLLLFLDQTITNPSINTDLHWISVCQNDTLILTLNGPGIGTNGPLAGRQIPTLSTSKKMDFYLITFSFYVLGLGFLKLYIVDKNALPKKSIFFMMYPNFLNKPLFRGLPTDQKVLDNCYRKSGLQPLIGIIIACCETENISWMSMVGACGKWWNEL